MTHQKPIELLRSMSFVLTPVLLVFIAWMQLAEDKRTTDSWETAAFERRIVSILNVELLNRNLATKDDVRRIEDQVSKLSTKLEPITAHLIRTGVIQ